MSDHITRIIERTENEQGWLDQLLADPRSAVSGMGVQLSDEEVETLRSLSADDFRAFASEYATASDPEKRRAAC